MVRKKNDGAEVPPGTPVALDVVPQGDFIAFRIGPVSFLVDPATARNFAEKTLASCGLAGEHVLDAVPDGDHVNLLVGSLVVEVEPAAAQNFAENIFAAVGKILRKEFTLVAAGYSWSSRKKRR